MIAAFALPAVLALLPAASQETWSVRADTVYTAAGDPIEGGVVVVENGKIAAVGTGGGSGDVLEAAAVTPGMIDLACRITTRDYSVEQSTETAIDMRVADGLDPFSYRWAREAGSGVTTVMVSPYDLDVLGGFSVVLKTAGEESIEARTVAAEPCLRGCIGTQPSNGNFAPRGGPPATFYARRPTTRMGVEWVFRKTYYDLLNAERTGATADAETRAQREVLKRTLSGELPVVLRALATQDVRTAIYLKEEFGIPNMIIDGAVEAWKEPELVRRSGVGLILAPHPKEGRVPDGFVNDSYFYALDSAAMFHALGVRIALSGGGAADVGSRMGRQAGFAMRGGLPFDAALAAVTIDPARMVGVDDRVGSIEVGKDADLVLWNGKPFEATSAIIGVLVDGRLVVDPRSPQ